MKSVITTIFLVRHAEPDFTVREDLIRPLTPKGWADRLLVTGCLWNEDIDVVCSSPYLRALDTIRDFADKRSLPIFEITDFRERHAGTGWVSVEEFWRRERLQWEDMTRTFSDEESLAEVEARVCPAFARLLRERAGCRIAIAGHGTAFCVLLHSLDPTFGYEEYRQICSRNPWIVKLTFQNDKLLSREELL